VALEVAGSIPVARPNKFGFSARATPPKQSDNE
jgi:hypothetical protein